MPCRHAHEPNNVAITRTARLVLRIRAFDLAASVALIPFFNNTFDLQKQTGDHKC